MNDLDMCYHTNQRDSEARLREGPDGKRTQAAARQVGKFAVVLQNRAGFVVNLFFCTQNGRVKFQALVPCSGSIVSYFCSFPRKMSTDPRDCCTCGEKTPLSLPTDLASGIFGSGAIARSSW